MKKGKKNNGMNEEEYRLNKDIIEEIAFSPGKTSNKFLI